MPRLQGGMYMALEKILNNIQGNPAVTGALSGAAGGALVTAFANKKSAKKLLKAGGLVAVGGLAWQAYQRYKSQPEASQVSQAQTVEKAQFDALLEDNSSDNGINLVISSMIAAAHADGQLTEEEKQRIWQQAVEAGLSGEELGALAGELDQPCSIEQLAVAADSFEKRLETYSAALLIIEEDCEAGTRFLNQLGETLEVPGALRQVLHQEVRTDVAA